MFFPPTEARAFFTFTSFCELFPRSNGAKLSFLTNDIPHPPPVAPLGPLLNGPLLGPRAPRKWRKTCCVRRYMKP